MADLTLKRFDTYPPLAVTLSDTNGVIDLTAASAVHLEMKAQTGGTLIASLGCTIASAPGGYIKRTWSGAAGGETSMVDTWNCEFEIQWAGGGVQTVPNDGVKSIAVVSDIEGS